MPNSRILLVTLNNEFQCLRFAFKESMGKRARTEWILPDKPVFLGHISISVLAFSHCSIIIDENHSFCHSCHTRLLSNYCVPGSMLSLHRDSSRSSWYSKMQSPKTPINKKQTSQAQLKCVCFCEAGQGLALELALTFKQS